MQKDKKCIDLEVSYYMKCETEIVKNEIDESSRKRRNSEEECLESVRAESLPYRFNEEIMVEPAVTPKLLSNFGMSRSYNKTCFFIDEELYRRKCGHLNPYYRSMSMTADKCRNKCLENRLCHTAQFYPGNVIWPTNDKPVCFLFPLGVRDCPWNGGEKMRNIDPVIKSQIKMIECTKPQCHYDEDNCKNVNAPGSTWFEAWCDYNWRYSQGLYHFECNSCQRFFEPEDCQSSIFCLSACFGWHTLSDLESKLKRPKPEDFNLSSDYAFVFTSWGSFFYKYHGDQTKVNKKKAEEICENENSYLPVPLSAEENKFLLTLGMRHNWLALQIHKPIWLGITETADQQWVTDHGDGVNWFNWNKDEPKNEVRIA